MSLRRRRLAPVVALVLGAALLVPAPAAAIPPGSPRTGMICNPGTLSAGTRTFNLVATTGHVSSPDGNSIFMWGFGNVDVPDNGAFQYPGPVLCVTQGETVVVNLTNSLPEPSSIVFPGQAGVAASGGSPGLLTREAAAAGGTVSYSFAASRPGTYLYESGSDVSKQVEMGLYGALVVRPSLGPGFAYDATTAFDPSHEFLILLSDFDTDLHHAVEVGGAYDFNLLHNRYYAVNGRMFPDTLQDNSSVLLPAQPYGSLVRIQPTTGGGQPALIRMINVGLANHPYHPHGNHMTQIAQDGGQLLSPGGAAASSERFGETIASGQTQDYLIRWDDVDNFNPVTNPLPVAPPSDLTLVLKDGTPWYSGNPYLGYKGTLPTGTNTLNVCGEWYFPWHSHALNEFANFDEPFGGMATLLRIDPPGGCFTAPTATTIGSGTLKGGSVTSLGVADTTYYQVNPKTTTRPTATTGGQTTITVASASGFPTTGSYYIRIDNEVMQVTGGQGTTTWTVSRGQLGTAGSAHLSGATITALADDWSATFSNVPAGSANLKVTYQGRNCGNTTGTGCTTIASNLPQQTVRICDWTISGAAGCATPWSNGWATLPVPAQPIAVGSTDVSNTWTATGPFARYIGTGSNKGQVRFLLHTQRWTAPSPTPFSTWGNFMKLVYDAP